MKKYEKQIADATEQIANLKAGHKAHSATLVQAKLNNLQRAISKNDEAGAEKAVQELTGEVKAVEAPVENKEAAAKKNK